MKSIFRFLKIDNAIAYTLLGRGWSMFSGLISLYFIVRYLTPAEQGFYYAFSSILGLQIMFELGMSFVVMQMASHEMAHMTWTPNDTLVGDDNAKSRLRSLLVLVVKWYGVVAILIVLILMPAGWLFFTINHHDSNVSWHLPWIILIITAAVTICLVPVFAIFEGCGRMAEVAVVRLCQAVVGSLSVWLVLFSGGGLLAMPLMNTGMVLIAILWLYSKRGFFRNLLMDRVLKTRINWKREIWPFQWKIALSWLSGYFIFQLFTPVLFAYRGPVEAGQMGLSLNIAGTIMAIPVAWMGTKAPRFGALIAKKNYLELDSLYFSAFKMSFGVMIVLAIGLSLANVISYYYNLKISLRVLEPRTFSILMATTVINYVLNAQATYLRSHKQEPFLLLSVFSGILIGASSVILGKNYGSMGIVTAYFFIGVLGLFYGTWIFYAKRKLWH